MTIRPLKELWTTGKDDSGATQVEQVILLVAVAIGFAAAAVPLGAILLEYHKGIELVLGLPVP